jgi:hypothetical protein
MGGSFSTGKGGEKDRPVEIRAAGEKGYAVLKVGGQVGFRVNGKHLVLRGLHIQGNPKSTQATVFMDGPAGCSDVLMVDCKISGSSQHGMKAARTREKAADNITIENTELFDTAASGFDLVSGDNWTLRRCYAHDFGKGGGVTYGIFLKGGGKNGIIEGCLVDGRKQKITVGISFGGGLTGEKWLPLVDGKVGAEHTDGVARNNVVINTGDVAYHSNNGSKCSFVNNLAFGCSGFQRQASYPPDPVVVNNLISGNTSKGASRSANNLAVKAEWFVAPDKLDFRLSDAGRTALAGKGVSLPECPTDIFGTRRDAAKPFPGPVLPEATETAVWVDRRK